MYAFYHYFNHQWDRNRTGQQYDEDITRDNKYIYIIIWNSILPKKKIQISLKYYFLLVEQIITSKILLYNCLNIS